jgi:hypothetical protein
VITWIDTNAGIHSDALHIVETYRMLDADTIRYEAVLDDVRPGQTMALRDDASNVALLTTSYSSTTALRTTNLTIIQGR